MVIWRVLHWEGICLENEIPGVELEVAELRESGTEYFYSGYISGVNGYVKLEGYTLRDNLFSSERKTKVGTSVCSSYGEVGYYVVILVGFIYGNLEGSTLGGKLFGDGGYEKGSSNGRSYESVDERIEEFPLGEQLFGS